MNPFAYNGVSYNVQGSDDLSLVSDRNQRQHAPMTGATPSTSAQSQTVCHPSVWKLSVGNRFMDPSSSYLSFRVRAYSNAVGSNKLQTSWLSLVRAITLTDSRGLELERITELGKLNALVASSIFGDDWMTCNGFALGSELGTRDLGVSVGPGPTFVSEPGAWHIVIIPLPLLCGLFRVPNLLPPHLIDGLQMRIDWADTGDVLIQNIHKTSYSGASLSVANELGDNNLNSLDLPSYEIDSLQIVLDEYTLDPRLESQIDAQYTKSGLGVRMSSWTHVNKTESITLDAVNIDVPIKHAFTRALKVVGQVVHAPPASGYTIWSDFLSRHYTVDGKTSFPTLMQNSGYPAGCKYDIRLNGVSYPQEPVTTQAQSYFQWISAWDRNRVTSKGSVYQAVNHRAHRGLSFTASLDRASASALVPSGVRVDGTAPLSVRLQLATDTSDGYTPSADWPDKLKTAITTQNRRELNLWVEHERYILLSPSSNLVVT